MGMSLNCGIYALKNTANGKVYVGQSVTVAHKARVAAQGVRA